MHNHPMPELGPSPLIDADAHLSVDDARAAVHRGLRPIEGTETVALHDALGRVLAADLVSPIDVPAHDNSAMDGYAFDGAALPAEGTATLRIVATVYAGAPMDGTLAHGEAARIMTGAVMPAGADTVVPQELCRADSDTVHIDAGAVRAGENRRRRGSACRGRRC
jgi:molybdopterin molybdotransferase